MALIETEGKCDVDLDTFATTSPTIVKSTGANSDTKVKARNFVAGIPNQKAQETITPQKESILKRFLTKIFDNTLTLIFTVASGVIGIIVISWLNLK